MSGIEQVRDISMLSIPQLYMDIKKYAAAFEEEDPLSLGVYIQRLVFQHPNIQEVARRPALLKLICEFVSKQDKSDFLKINSLSELYVQLIKHQDEKVLDETFQSYRDALSIVHDLENTEKTEKVEDFILKHRFQPEYRMVMQFVSGMLKEKPIQLNRFFGLLMKEPHTIGRLRELAVWVLCLEECGVSHQLSIRRDFLEKLKQYVQQMECSSHFSIWDYSWECLVPVLLSSPSVLKEANLLSARFLGMKTPCTLKSSLFYVKTLHFNPLGIIKSHLYLLVSLLKSDAENLKESAKISLLFLVPYLTKEQRTYLLGLLMDPSTLYAALDFEGIREVLLVLFLQMENMNDQKYFLFYLKKSFSDHSEILMDALEKLMPVFNLYQRSSVLYVLTSTLESHDVKISAMAARFLSKYVGHLKFKVKYKLFNYLKDACLRYLDRGLSSVIKIKSIYAEALNALVISRYADMSEFFYDIQNLLNDKKVKNKIGALIVLSNLISHWDSGQKKSFFDACQKLLESPNPVIQEMAIQSLEKIIPHLDESQRQSLFFPLFEAFSSRSLRVSESAARVLFKLLPDFTRNQKLSMPVILRATLSLERYREKMLVAQTLERLLIEFPFLDTQEYTNEILKMMLLEKGFRGEINYLVLQKFLRSKTTEQEFIFKKVVETL